MNIENKEQIKDVMTQCFASTKISSQILFPEIFYRPFSSITDPVFKALDDDSIQKVVIKAPRGWGKTSIANLAYPAKKCLFREKKYIVPISNTATQAIMQGENLKRELLSNETILKIFGSVKSNTFSKEIWETQWGTAVMPRGAGQQVRGIKYGRYRPDLIIFDDVEDSEAVESDEQRQKLKQWMFSDVLNSVDRGSKDWKIVFIGTLLHEDSLLAALLADPTWHVIEIDLCDDTLKSNWPDFMSDGDIRELYESYKIQGLLDVFYREYRGLPIARETATFKAEYFKYYLESDATFTDQKSKMENVVIIDPAKTTNMTSADSAIVGIGVNTLIPRVYIRDIDAGKFHPDEIYERAFAMADRIGARTIGYEVTSLNEFITYPITTQMIKRGKFYQLIELKARASKEERVAMLSPLYRLGYVYHNQNISSILESQLLGFPKSKRWDVMDATAYIVELLELGERYFAPEIDLGTELDREDEFSSLDADYDPPIPNWRAA